MSSSTTTTSEQSLKQYDQKKSIEKMKYETNKSMTESIHLEILVIRQYIYRNSDKEKLIKFLLERLEKNISLIKQHDFNLFGYSKYVIADIQLSDLRLSEEKQVQYQNDKKQYNLRYQFISGQLQEKLLTQLKGQQDQLSSTIVNNMIDQQNPISQISYLVSKLLKTQESIEKKDFKLQGQYSYVKAKEFLKQTKINMKKKDNNNSNPLLKREEDIDGRMVSIIKVEQKLIESIMSGERIEASIVLKTISMLEKKVDWLIRLDIKFEKIYLYYVTKISQSQNNISDEKRQKYIELREQLNEKKNKLKKSTTDSNFLLLEIKLIKERICKFIQEYPKDTKNITQPLEILDKEIIKLQKKNIHLFRCFKEFINKTELGDLKMESSQPENSKKIQEDLQIFKITKQIMKLEDQPKQNDEIKSIILISESQKNGANEKNLFKETTQTSQLLKQKEVSYIGIINESSREQNTDDDKQISLKNQQKEVSYIGINSQVDISCQEINVKDEVMTKRQSNKEDNKIQNTNQDNQCTENINTPNQTNKIIQNNPNPQKEIIMIQQQQRIIKKQKEQSDHFDSFEAKQEINLDVKQNQIYQNLYQEYKHYLSNLGHYDQFQKTQEQKDHKQNINQDNVHLQLQIQEHQIKQPFFSNKTNGMKVFQNFKNRIEGVYSELCSFLIQEPIIKFDNNIYVKNDINFNLIKKRKYLLLGLTGGGKSSFIQQYTKNQEVKIGHGKNSETQECNKFYSEAGICFIDSPGIDDTKKSRYEILYKIVKYLHSDSKQSQFDNHQFQTCDRILKNNKEQLTQKKNKFEQKTPDDLFILLVQNDDMIRTKLIQEFAYAYFLYDTFQNEISPEEIEVLIQEYFQSNNLLNFKDCNFDLKRDDLKEKRKKICQKKDIAFNYEQMIVDYHITVKTHFDKKPRPDLQDFDENMVSFLKEQIWSNKTTNMKIFYEYEKEIQNQEIHLFQKISKITEIQNRNEKARGNLNIQNIVLIGNSQVGKSSMIEQITKLSGLRGSGKQSTTSFCSSYILENKGVLYRFIDTPGFEGNENNQIPMHCLKIISNYLRRNLINDFKILFMVSDIEKRDKMEPILKKLFIFLDEMFDDDITFLDSEYLKNLFMLNNQESHNSKYGIDFIKDKILKVERKYAISKEDKINMNDFNKEDRYDPEETFQNENNITTMRFQNNYFTKKQDPIIVDEDINRVQIDTLFKTLLQINPINIEEKLIVKINKLNNIQIINNAEHYQEWYLRISILKSLDKLIRIIQQQEKNLSEQKGNEYELLYVESYILIKYIEKQIQSLRVFLIMKSEEESKAIDRLFLNFKDIKQLMIIEPKNLNALTEMRQKILKELDQINLVISFEIFNSPKIQKFNEEQKLKNQNSVLKYFIFLKYEPYLFEDQITGKHILISRKQLFYTQYSYQLNCFLKKGDTNNFQNKVEEIAMIKVNQDLALLSHLQKKIWEQNKKEETIIVISLIKELIDAQNIIINSGVQIYKYATQFNLTIESFKKLKNQFCSNPTQFFQHIQWARSLLEIASQGMDIYQVTKQYLDGSYLSFLAYFFLPENSFLSTFMGKFSILFFLAATTYYVFKNLFYNNSKHIEKIRQFIPDFIEDSLSNQNLLYFQKAQFIQNKLNANTYKQLLEKSLSDFESLSKDNFKEQKQEKILKSVFSQMQTNNSTLQDTITRHISQQICKKFCLDFEIKKNEKQPVFLQRSLEQCKGNEKLMDYFIPSFKKLLSVKSAQNDVIEMIKTKLKDDSNSNDNDNVWNQKEQTLLDTYLSNLQEFIIESQNFDDKTKSDIIDVSKKIQCIPIIFTSYCNLIQEKVEFKFKNTILINELQREDNNSNGFRLLIKDNNQTQSNENIFQQRMKKIDKLELFCACEKFTANRYLNKIKGQEYNISSLQKTEILNAEIEHSIDLYHLIKDNNLNDFKQFQKYIQEKTGSTFDPEQEQRLNNFFKSIPILEEEFKLYN